MATRRLTTNVRASHGGLRTFNNAHRCLSFRAQGGDAKEGLKQRSRVLALAEQERVETEEALRLFESLQPVGVQECIGARWRGAPIWTDNKLFTLLKELKWTGKAFLSEEEAHPLLLEGFTEGKELSVRPSGAMLGLFSKMGPGMAKRVAPVFRAAAPLFRTRRSSARMREVVHRGVLSAAMVYDDLPAIDQLRKEVDEHSGETRALMGEMDLKGEPAPLFFCLTSPSDPARIAPDGAGER